MRWPLHRIGDLTNDDIADILGRSRFFADGGTLVASGVPRTVGLIFYETSLRTRIGFSSAAHRLGAHTVDVYEPRASTLSMPESWDDTIRTVAGYCDAIVGRPAFASNEAEAVAVDIPYINGGDRTNDPEHPSQALIDVFAIERLATRPVRVVTLIGDPGMRAARSLLPLLGRNESVEIVVVTDDEFVDRSGKAFRRSDHVPEETDVLYVTGMAHESIDLARRERLLVSRQTLDALSPNAIVLSPMPVIDEITPAARTDRRVAIHEQSRLGLSVRMALLSCALGLLVPGGAD